MQGRDSPLLSIVIATRNRKPFALSAIQAVLEISDPRLELVVQDNSDSSELDSVISEQVHDSRLRYRHTSGRLSMVDNFNLAMELATGEYVCLIGDDDGVNPEIVEAAAWAKSEDLDSLSVRPSAFYLWPGTGLSSTVFTTVVGGSLSVGPFSGGLAIGEPEKELLALLRNGGLYYLDFKLPKAYHGLARRQCLEDIRQRGGSYFGGLSPDIFTSVALACVCRRVASIEYPLTIPGHCSVAEKTHHVKDAHLRPFAEAPHFYGRGDYQWCPLVPQVFIGEAFWVDSAIAALRAMGREELVKELNLPKLAAHCLGAYRGVARPVLSCMLRGLRSTGKNRLLGVFAMFWGLCSGPGHRLVHRGWNRALIMLGIRQIHAIRELATIRECSRSLTGYLQMKGLSFSEAIRRKA